MSCADGLCDAVLVTWTTATTDPGQPESDFESLVSPFRRELQAHCYRITGSLSDAEDLLQETLLAAWRALPEFRADSSVRTWLHRIATHRSLNLLRTRGRRPTTVPLPPFAPPPTAARDDTPWLQPWPGPDPADATISGESVRLAFVVALQHLPPRQVAALLLCDVLAFSMAETAELLGSTPAAVKGALQRARAGVAGIESHDPESASGERDLADRFARAFAADDVDGVIGLLTDDAFLTMPPAPQRYVGRGAIAEFLRASISWRPDRPVRLAPTVANGQPAFTVTMTEPVRAGGVLVLTMRGGRISGLTRFLEPSWDELQDNSSQNTFTPRA
jgi:RNA polymerase sigma-70 factor (TIGR02960 family)